MTAVRVWGVACYVVTWGFWYTIAYLAPPADGLETSHIFLTAVALCQAVNFFLGPAHRWRDILPATRWLGYQFRDAWSGNKLGNQRPNFLKWALAQSDQEEDVSTDKEVAATTTETEAVTTPSYSSLRVQFMDSEPTNKDAELPFDVFVYVGVMPPVLYARRYEEEKKAEGDKVGTEAGWRMMRVGTVEETSVGALMFASCNTMGLMFNFFQMENAEQALEWFKVCQRTPETENDPAFDILVDRDKEKIEFMVDALSIRRWYTRQLAKREVRVPADGGVIDRDISV